MAAASASRGDLGAGRNALFGIGTQRRDLRRIRRNRRKGFELGRERRAAVERRLQRRSGDGERDLRLRGLRLDLAGELRHRLFQRGEPAFLRRRRLAGGFHQRVEPGQFFVERAEIDRRRAAGLAEGGDRRLDLLDLVAKCCKPGIVAGAALLDRRFQRRDIGLDLIQRRRQPVHLGRCVAVAAGFLEVGDLALQRGDLAIDAVERDRARTGTRRAEQAGKLQPAGADQRDDTADDAGGDAVDAATLRLRCHGLVPRFGCSRCFLGARPRLGDASSKL